MEGGTVKLFEHQEEGVRFLEERGGCGLLGCSPGVGKTLMALEYIRRSKSFPLLVIAPVSLLGMWEAEIGRWYGWRTALLRGTKEKRSHALLSHAPVYICGYETFRTDWKDIVAIPFKACITDESGKIRTPTSKISKILRAFRPSSRIALDGTPISNSIADLWSPVEWVSPGTFYGNWWKFRNAHAQMNPYIPGKIDGWRNTDWIVATANKHIFWKKKEDVLHDLPPMTETDIPLVMNAPERKMYKRIKEELRVEIEGQEDITITNALALLMRLRQAANGVFTESQPTKERAVIELVEALPKNEKVVIFSQFETVVSGLCATLPFLCVKITGAMSQEEREESLKRFENNPMIRAIVMTSAGERGLNLQGASFVIQYDLPWSYASLDQRIGRVWRHGQTKPVTVYNLLCEGTVDMHMKKILSRKKSLAESAITYDDIQAILA